MATRLRSPSPRLRSPSPIPRGRDHSAERTRQGSLERQRQRERERGREREDSLERHRERERSLERHRERERSLERHREHDRRHRHHRDDPFPDLDDDGDGALGLGLRLELAPEARHEHLHRAPAREVTVSTPYMRIHRHDLHSAHAQHAVLRLYRDLIRREQERPRPNITSLEIGPEDDHAHVLVAVVRFGDGHGEHDRDWRAFWHDVLDEHVRLGSSVRVHSFSPVLSMQRTVRESRVGLHGEQDDDGRLLAVGEEHGLGGFVRKEERSHFWAQVDHLLP